MNNTGAKRCRAPASPPARGRNLASPAAHAHSTRCALSWNAGRIHCVRARFARDTAFFNNPQFPITLVMDKQAGDERHGAVAPCSRGGTRPYCPASSWSFSAAITTAEFGPPVGPPSLFISAPRLTVDWPEAQDNFNFNFNNYREVQRYRPLRVRSSSPGTRQTTYM
jgi:hypothetical protein